MGLVEILRQYGWKICILALIGCILVGIIKTPINIAIKRKLDKISADEAKRKKVNTIYDSLVYIGNYLIALIATVICNFIYTMRLPVKELFEMSLQTWLLQNAFYGIWKKLGLKGLLLVLFRGLRNWFKNLFDKDDDGKVTPSEVNDTVQDFVKDGKLDSGKLFGKITDKVPNLVVDIINEASEAADVEISNDTDKAKEELKTKVIDLTEASNINKIKF